MSCPTCQAGLPPDQSHCPVCGAPNPNAAGSAETTAIGFKPASTETFAPGSAPPPPPPKTSAGPHVEPVMGFVAVYSDAAGDGDDAHHGRLYALHQGEVLFIGKAPAPTEVARSDGQKVAPAAAHLFPFTEGYAHISRRHLTLEMEPDGTTRIIDTSTNGIFLTGPGKYLRRTGSDPAVHTFEGNEMVVLGVDLNAGRDPAAKEKALRYRLQIIRPMAPAGGPHA